MKTRQLGKLTVSELGFGCMSISANYGPATDRIQGMVIIASKFGFDNENGGTLNSHRNTSGT